MSLAHKCQNHQEALELAMSAVRTAGSLNADDYPCTLIYEVGSVRYVLIIREGHDQDYRTRRDFYFTEHSYRTAGGIPYMSTQHVEGAPEDVALAKIQVLLNAYSKIDQNVARMRRHLIAAELPEDYGQW